MGFLFKEFADFMADRGHEVDVITGYPNWPSGKCFEGYAYNNFSSERMGKINVFRIPFFASPNGSALQRLLDFKSFEFNCVRYGKRLQCPDIIYVNVPPNEDAFAALRLARHFNALCIVNVQDIQPDGAIALGYIKNPLLIWILRAQVKAMYERADHLVAIGDNFKRCLQEKNVPMSKISVIPNWIDAKSVVSLPRMNRLRQEWDIPADSFVVLYAGTFGRVHDTRILLEAARRLSNNKNIIFVLVGQGYDFKRNQELAVEWGLKNVLIKDFVPRERLSEMQSLSDISVVTLKKGFGNSSVPSKVLGYMSAGRGVIALVDAECDSAKLVENASCGIVINPGETEEFVQQVTSLSMHRSIAVDWGINAREYVLKYLDTDVVLSSAAELFERLYDKNKR